MMKRSLIKRTGAVVLACVLLSGYGGGFPSAADTLEIKDPDELMSNFNATDANAVVSYENVDFDDVIVKEMKAHFSDAKNARNELEKAAEKYDKAVANNEKEKDIEKKKATLEEKEAKFNEKAGYEIRLKNLLMVSGEGVAENKNSEDLKESKSEAACPYHLNAFHSSDAFKIFEPETQETDLAEENAAPKMEDAAEDTTISAEQQEKLIEGVSEPVYAGGYVEFKRHIYSSQKLEGAGILIKDSEGNPLKDANGEFVTSQGTLTENKDEFLTITFSTNEIVGIDETTGVNIKKTYQGKFTLEDDNIINFIRYKSHNGTITQKQYELIYNFVDPEAKNLKGKALDDDAKKAAAYLPPPEYIGTFVGYDDSDTLLNFFTTNLFSPYSDDAFKKSKLKDNAELNLLKSAAKKNVTKVNMGYYHRLTCPTHMTSYHIITQPLIDYVTQSKFNAWLEKYNNFPEKVNIVQFRKDFNIDIETFKTLTLDPNLSMAPYNVEKVYADDTTSGIYFRFGKAL